MCVLEIMDNRSVLSGREGISKDINLTALGKMSFLKRVKIMSSEVN